MFINYVYIIVKLYAYYKTMYKCTISMWYAFTMNTYSTWTWLLYKFRKIQFNQIKIKKKPRFIDNVVNIWHCSIGIKHSTCRDAFVFVSTIHVLVRWKCNCLMTIYIYSFGLNSWTKIINKIKRHALFFFFVVVVLL